MIFSSKSVIHPSSFLVNNLLFYFFHKKPNKCNAYQHYTAYLIYRYALSKMIITQIIKQEFKKRTRDHCDIHYISFSAESIQDKEYEQKTYSFDQLNRNKRYILSIRIDNRKRTVVGKAAATARNKTACF